MQFKWERTEFAIELNYGKQVETHPDKNINIVKFRNSSSQLLETSTTVDRNNNGPLIKNINGVKIYNF